jgi:acetyl-CoA carboxylase carboxyltransferase component
VLDNLLPADRRYSYHVRKVIEALADSASFLEVTAGFGGAIITGFMRLEGRPMGLIASDCRVLGGAIDADAAEKAARFLRLCSSHGLPVLSLCDTPGFMVGPASEEQAAVRHMCAMAMAGGSFAEPVYTAAWPSGEFGGMGLEGAVRLGFRKELEAESDPQKREALFDSLVTTLYEKGRAVEAATHLEIDAVIVPSETRRHVSRALDLAV